MMLAVKTFWEAIWQKALNPLKIIISFGQVIPLMNLP